MSLEENLEKSAEKKGLSGKEKERYIGGTIENLRKKGKLSMTRGKEEKKPKQEEHSQAEEKRYEELKHKMNFSSISQAEYAEYQRIAPYWIKKHREKIQADPYYYTVVKYKKTRTGKVKKEEQSFTEKDLAENEAKRNRYYVPLLYEKVEVETRLKKRK